MNDNQQKLLIIGESEGLGNAGLVNISATADAEARLAELQYAYPRPLQILHAEPGAGDLVPVLLDQFAAFKLLNGWCDFGLHDALRTIRAAIEVHQLLAEAEKKLERKLVGQVVQELRAQG